MRDGEKLIKEISMEISGWTFAKEERNIIHQNNSRSKCLCIPVSQAWITWLPHNWLAELEAKIYLGF